MELTQQTSKTWDQFGIDLINEIHNYIKKNGRYANSAFWIKAVTLITLWIALYIGIVFSDLPVIVAFFLSILWGICSLLIVFNIGHDAVHEVISSHKIINSIFKYSFNLVGGNAYSWKLKHNIAHHINTNVEGMDFDTDLSPLMRLSPTSPYKKQYQWQHFTVFLIYPLLSLLLIFVSDFKIFFQTKKAGMIKEHPLKEWVILIISKIWYLTIIFVIPLSYSSYNFYQILFTFISFHLVNGIIIACVFMPSHYFSGSHYFIKKPVDYNWYRHQLSTTMDLSPDNRYISALLGGLNLNVAHHLYPKTCHTNYFELTRIVKQRVQQYGLEYNNLPYLSALYQHIKYLHQLGNSDE